MAFLEGETLASLKITKMVFHLVGPTEENFVRLEAVAPGRFSSFFLERIRSCNSGLPYQFSDASATRERLGRIAGDLRLFQEESEKLAEDFQRKHGGTTAAGAFLVFVLDAEGEQIFALLKYDDEAVLKYEIQEGRAGRKRVSLDSLNRTFVQNREALQKSALIRLTDNGGELVVLDRRNQQNVARYFEGFLDAIRIHENADLTEKLVQVTRDVIKDNKDMVPPEVFRERIRRTYDAARAGGTIDAENQKSFLDAVFGAPLPNDHALIQKFQSALRKARIDGTPLVLDPTKVRPPSVTRIVTQNNIQLRIPNDVRNFVDVGPNQIVIHDRVQETYDDTDRGR